MPGTLTSESMQQPQDGGKKFFVTLAKDALGQTCLIVPGDQHIAGDDGDRFPAQWMPSPSPFPLMQITFSPVAPPTANSNEQKP